MKKLICSVLACGMLLSFAACSSSAPEVSGVSQEEYDQLQSDFMELQSKYNSLKIDYDALAAKAVAETSTPSATPAANELRSPESGVPIHDDENVTLSFLGCEVNDRGEECLVFYVVNKTDIELTFQGAAMAINGESLGDTSGSEDIAAQSKGKIRFRTEEPFPTMTPDTLSGAISVIDFTYDTLEDSYEVPFTNLNVGTGASNSAASTVSGSGDESAGDLENAADIKTRLVNFCIPADMRNSYSCEILEDSSASGHTANIELFIDDASATSEQLDELLDSFSETLTDWQGTEYIGAPSLKSAHIVLIQNSENVREKTVEFN